jgi:hypothetical protein
MLNFSKLTAMAQGRCYTLPFLSVLGYSQFVTSFLSSDLG